MTRKYGLGLVLVLIPFLTVHAQADSGRALPNGPLTLLEAIRLGRERGVAAAVAQLSAAAAQARAGQRAGALLPQISGSANYSRQTLNFDEFGVDFASGVTDPFNIFRLQVRLDQVIFDPAAIGRLRAAREHAVAAGLDARSAGELAGATAGLAYLRVLSARETVRAREADSAVAAALYDQARQLVEAGVSPAIDATRSQVSYAAVLTQLEIARNNRDRAELDLRRALDLPPVTPITLADSLVPEQVDLPESPDEAAQFAEEHRADLAAEAARTRAAERTLGAIRAENLPSLGFSGSFTESGQHTSTLEDTYSIQFGVTVPILDGFRRQRRSREQSLLVEAQRIQERNTRNQVDTDARQAVLDLASARQQVTLAAERLRLAELELSQARERFTAGVAGSVETTNAQGALVSARDAYIQARLNYASARVAAYRALGVIDQIGR